MRITFILPFANLSGGCRVVAIYAQKLQERGHEVLVVSAPSQPLKLRWKMKSLLRGQGWPKVPKAMSSHLDGTSVPHRILERYRPVADHDLPDGDVVVATWWGTVHWVAPLSHSKGAKVFFAQGYGVLPGEEHPQVDDAWRHPFHKITISNWLVRLAREKFEDTEVTHVPNAVDADQFFAPPRGKQSRPTIGLLYASGSVKGVDVSIRAIDLIRERLPDLRVVVFGSHEEIASLPLPRGAEFSLRPEQGRIREIYAECDVWLCGSRCEGFHLPPLEAMACRCPVVSTRVGGPADIIEDGINGFVVDIDDHGALADRAIRCLTLEESAWRSMSEAACRTATSYTWDEATDRFEAGLRRAVERQRGPAAVTMHAVGSQA